MKARCITKALNHFSFVGWWEGVFVWSLYNSQALSLITFSHVSTERPILAAMVIKLDLEKVPLPEPSRSLKMCGQREQTHQRDLRVPLTTAALSFFKI
jgi:hypothetical protein